jgi:hypothetical protein
LSIIRAILTNCGQLAGYDLCKSAILEYKLLEDNPACHTLASVGASTLLTTISQPADVVRSRLMAAKSVGPVRSTGREVWV